MDWTAAGYATLLALSLVGFGAIIGGEWAARRTRKISMHTVEPIENRVKAIEDRVKAIESPPFKPKFGDWVKAFNPGEKRWHDCIYMYEAYGRHYVMRYNETKEMKSTSSFDTDEVKPA